MAARRWRKVCPDYWEPGQMVGLCCPALVRLMAHLCRLLRCAKSSAIRHYGAPSGGDQRMRPGLDLQRDIRGIDYHLTENGCA
jgi:hypothetical protein